MTIQLRPDQAKLKADIYSAWNGGARDVLAVLPTGGGKSIVSSDITLDQSQLGATQCVIAHRTELVAQMSSHVARRGILHRVIAPKPIVAAIGQEHRREFGRSFVHPDAHCSVAAVDTLIARASQLAGWAGQVDLVTTDEAHHVLRSNKWGKARELFSRARGLGVTATPSRADGQGLGRDADGVFDAMVEGPTMRQLIEMGALTEYDIALAQSDLEVSEEDITGSGDFSPKKMRDAARKSRIVGDVVKEYVKLAYGKRAICFATDVETAGKIASDFNAMSIPAVAVSAETPSEVRAEMIRRFRDGSIWILVNVDLFGEGFDVPACEVVIMARPTASLGLYLQMFGRALRTMAGKLFGLIIDHVGNWKRHGFPDKHHFWTLDRREKRGKKEIDPEDIPLTSCRGCSRPYERFHPACPRCGWSPPLPEPGARTIEMVDGDLFLLGPERCAEMRAAATLPSPADVANRTAFVAGKLAAAGAVNRSIERHASQARLRAAMEQWGGIQFAKGRDQREAERRFFIAVGVDVLSALALPRADMDKLTAKIEGWYK